MTEKYFNLIKFVDLPFSIRYVPGGAMTTRLPIGRLGNNTPILLVSGQSGQFSIDTLHLACLMDQQFGVQQYISLQYIQSTILDLILGNAIHLEMKNISIFLVFKCCYEVSTQNIGFRRAEALIFKLQ